MVDDEARKLAKRQRTAAKETAAQLDALLEELCAARAAAEGAADDAAARAAAEALPARLRERGVVAGVNQQLKAVHAAVSKLGKAVERAAPMQGGLSLSLGDDEFVLRLLEQDLLRDGHAEAAAALGVGDGGGGGAAQALGEVQAAAAALAARDVGPAEHWAAARRAELQALGSPLAFDLAELRFVQLVAAGATGEALAFARAELAPRAGGGRHEALRRLMASLMYAGRLEGSPYADLAADARWAAARQRLVRDGCALLGMCASSPVATALAAGAAALPTLRKMAAVSAGALGSVGELPAELPLGRRFEFHSLFSCPVSRDVGPPALLRCGHVICEECVARIAKHRARFKCPTCPVETAVSEVLVVTF